MYFTANTSDVTPISDADLADVAGGVSMGARFLDDKMEKAGTLNAEIDRYWGWYSNVGCKTQGRDALGPLPEVSSLKDRNDWRAATVAIGMKCDRRFPVY